MRDTAEKVFYGSWCRIVNGVVIRKSPAKCWRFSRTFVRDFGLHISFTSRIAPHKEVNSSHFRKHWEIRVHEKVKKRSHHVANPRESQKDRRQKIWWGEETDHALRCLCFTQWICRSSFNRFVLPGEVVRWVFLLVLLEKLSRKKKSFLCLSCLKNRAEIKHSLLVLLEK